FKKNNININVSNVSIETALDACFKNLPIAYKIIDKTVVVRRVEGKISTAIEKEVIAVTVQGNVTDEKGLPMSGVSIKVKGTSMGTVTNANGAYTLEDVDEDATLIFSFIGFVSKEVGVNGQNRIS